MKYVTVILLSLCQLFLTGQSSAFSSTSPQSTVTIAVAGATGRTGSLVVEELIDRGVKVVALVRDEKKADTRFRSILQSSSSLLKIQKCDLASEKEIITSVNGCDAAIWCATGFSNNPNESPVDKFLKVFNAVVLPKRSIDLLGINSLAKALRNVSFTSSKIVSSDASVDNTGVLPSIVMCSSAGVTRPKWDDAKKAMFSGCADIPIVRLNPLGILDIKADSEEELRKAGVPYCIFRPTGLNEKHPAGSRPVFSQGDVAVGRINRKDVAKILVDSLFSTTAVGKTFEAFTLEGYTPATSIQKSLERLRKDSDGPPSLEVLTETYNVMQQLLPGEKQDAAALAMGQTYEQLDKGETGRLGPRGQERIP